MKIFIISFILGVLSLTIRAQGDTIYIYNDSILVGIRVFNKSIDNSKQGDWLEYSTIEFGLITDDAEDSFPTEIKFKYSSLDKSYDFDDFDTLITKSIIDGDTMKIVEYVRYVNIIAPDYYNIIGKGKYIDNTKFGIWSYYHENGTLKCEIEYSKGIPIRDYKIYNSDGRIKFTLKKQSQKVWEICKFDEREKLISCENLDMKIVDFLY